MNFHFFFLWTIPLTGTKDPCLILLIVLSDDEGRRSARYYFQGTLKQTEDMVDGQIWKVSGCFFVRCTHPHARICYSEHLRIWTSPLSCESLPFSIMWAGFKIYASKLKYQTGFEDRFFFSPMNNSWMKALLPARVRLTRLSGHTHPHTCSKQW